VVKAAWFDGKTIDNKLGLIHQRTGPQKTAGKSVIFATTPLEGMRTILPSLTAAVNTLEQGGDEPDNRLVRPTTLGRGAARPRRHRHWRHWP